MASFQIRNNKDLLRYLEILERKTIEYMNSDNRGFEDLEDDEVELLTDLIIGDGVARKIAEKLTYFKGVLNCNNHTILNAASIEFSLFSSSYMAEVNNLTIHNQKGSLGMTFALDVSQTKFNNYKLTGLPVISRTSGGIAKTSHYNVFNNCSVDIETLNRASTMSVDEEGTELTSFGAYVCNELGHSVYNNCSVAGHLVSENNVAGFCAVSKNVEFNVCSVNGLKLLGKRNIGLFVGSATGPIKLTDCTIDGSELAGSIYLGWIVGATTSSVICDNLTVTETLINPEFTSSYVGSIAGTAESVIVKNSSLLGSVSGNFIIAGLCPDTREGILENSLVEITVTATGYSPMVTHAYELFRDEDLTSNGKEIKISLERNEVKVDLIELGMGGYINPFGKVIV